MSHWKYKLFHGLGRYRGVEKRAQSQPSKKVFWEGWWAVSESMRWNWIEWKAGVWGEGHIWDIPTWAIADSKGHKLESPYWLSSWVTFLLRAQPGVDLRRWGGKRAESLLPLPGSPSCACDSHRNAKGTKISWFFLCCSKAAVLSRAGFDLCTFSGFLSVRHILLEFWQVFFL